MSQRRDSQRGRLLEAEWAVTWAAPRTSTSDIHPWLRDKLVSKWWTFRVEKTDLPLAAKRKWEVTPGVQFYDRRTCHPNYCGMVRVDNSETTSLLDVCHQLAHTLTPQSETIAFHGPAFTRNYLIVVRRLLGDEMWALLRRAFREHKVKIITVDDHLREVRRVYWYKRQLVGVPSIAEMVQDLERNG